MNNTFPRVGMELTHLFAVSDMDKSRAFSKDVLGATLYQEYGGTSCVLQILGNWLFLVIGGIAAGDKPDVVFAPPESPNTVSHEFTIRVPDCHGAYEVLRSRGAKFLTPPYNWGPEIRCFFRDPDGNLLEISQLV